MAQKLLFQKLRHSCLKLWPKTVRTCFTESAGEKEESVIYSIKSVNEVKLLGYVGQFPKKYQMPGKTVTHFTLATTRIFVDKTAIKHKITTWHTILVRAPFLQEYVMKYIGKGTRVYVSGYIEDRASDLSQEFQTNVSMHVVASEVIFLKRSSFSQQENSPFLAPISDHYGE